MINILAAAVIAAANLTSTGGSWICPILDRNPNDSGVTTVVLRVLSEGYSSSSGADLIVNTVASTCPKYLPLLQEWADAHG